MSMVIVPRAAIGGGPINGSYHSLFPAVENPITEGGAWINGATLGLDWHDAKTLAAPARVVGTQSGTDAPPQRYGDTIALLTGTWGNDQTAQATVYSVNQQSGSVFEEVELRLRSALSAHGATGYEILFSARPLSSSPYVQIVRWNGALGDFDLLASATGPGLANGDVVKATIVGTTIRAYINDVEITNATNVAYATGRPGLGCFYQVDDSQTGTVNDFGFTDFTAYDSAHVP